MQAPPSLQKQEPWPTLELGLNRGTLDEDATSTRKHLSNLRTFFEALEVEVKLSIKRQLA